MYSCLVRCILKYHVRFNEMIKGKNEERKMESRAEMRREEGIKGKMTAYLSHIIMEYI